MYVNCLAENKYSLHTRSLPFRKFISNFLLVLLHTMGAAISWWFLNVQIQWRNVFEGHSTTHSPVSPDSYQSLLRKLCVSFVWLCRV